MDSKGLVKLALVGAAGYWVYSNFFGGSIGSLLGSPAASSGGAVVPTPAPPTSSGTTPAPAPISTTPAPAPPAAVAPMPTNPDAINASLLSGWQRAGVNTDLLLGGAASIKSKAGDSGQYRLNWHQWNYYRTAYSAANGLGLPNYAPEDVGEGDGSKLYTAAEYQAVLTSRGEPYASGLGGIVPVGSAWFVQGRPLSSRPLFPIRVVRR